jgi:hypothetical protein
MKMYINVTNIKWRKTDNDGNPVPRKVLKKLPKEIDVELDDGIHMDLDDEITDFLRDTYEHELESFSYSYEKDIDDNDFIDIDFFGIHVNSVEANVS